MTRVIWNFLDHFQLGFRKSSNQLTTYHQQPTNRSTDHRPVRLFLKLPTNWPPTIDHLPTNQPITYHRPTTNQPSSKCTNHRPTDHRPIRNMRTRNSITNFKSISEKKIWNRVINTMSRMWVIIFWIIK